MSYKDLVSQAIEASDFSIKEVAEQCKKYGVSITPSYISLLKSGKTSSPSEEVSRAIANVCGIDENVLIIEAYLEKAPYILKTLLNRFKYEKDSNKLMQLYYHEENTESPEEKEIINKHREYIKKRLLSEFIVDAYEEHDPTPVYELESDGNSKHSGEKIYNHDESINFMKIDVRDNSMSPLITKNSKVYFEHCKGYRNGDIVCFIINSDNNDNVLIRKYFIKENLVILSALNNDFEPMVYNDSEIKVLGKVNKVVVNI